jgi:hypothetical protein
MAIKDFGAARSARAIRRSLDSGSPARRLVSCCARKRAPFSVMVGGAAISKSSLRAPALRAIGKQDELIVSEIPIPSGNAVLVAPPAALFRKSSIRR